MKNILKISFLLIVFVSSAVFAQNADPMGQIFNKLHDQLSPACKAKIDSNNTGCEAKISKYFTPDSIKNMTAQLEKAAKAGNMTKVQELSKLMMKKVCCGSWVGMDCAKDIVDKCAPTDKANFTKNFKNATDAMDKAFCSNYTYHSKECGYSPIINPINITINITVRGDIGKVIFANLTSKLTSQCANKIASRTKGCQDNLIKYLNSGRFQNLTDELEKAGKSGDKNRVNKLNDTMMKSVCCKIWTGYDCYKGLVASCDSNVIANFTKTFNNLTGTFEKMLCTNYKYHSSQCPSSGSSIISINFTLLTIMIACLIYFSNRSN